VIKILTMIFASDSTKTVFSVVVWLSGLVTLVVSALGIRARGPAGSNPGSRHYSTE